MAATDLLYVYSDIETDSFRGNQLLQIAAVAQTNETFNAYILPEGPLPLSITNFLGLYLYKGDLYRDGRKLPTQSPKTVLLRFMEWIEQLQRPVMLVFHNGFNFDCNVLVRHICKFCIETPRNLVKVGDTLPFFRTNLKAPEVPDHKLATLAKHFNIVQEHAHDALSDSITLKLICEKYAKEKDLNVSVIFEYSCREYDNFKHRFLYNTPMSKLKKPKKTKNAEGK